MFEDLNDLRKKYFERNEIFANILNALKKYAEFNGRARRQEFWFFSLFASIVSFIALAIHPLLLVIIYFALLLPSTAVTVRRLHDIDKSSWWYLILLVPIGGAIAFIIWACNKGTDGANRFGDDPLQEVTQSEK